MVTTTLLLALASLSGLPSDQTPTDPAVLPEQHAAGAHLFVPNGIAVPAEDRNDPGQLTGLFGRAGTNAGAAGFATAPVPDVVAVQGARRTRATRPPLCRF